MLWLYNHDASAIGDKFNATTFCMEDDTATFFISSPH
jgi:hypothetical protein